MNSSLKFIYLLSAISAGSLLSACSSEVPDNSYNGKGPEVSFAVSDISRATTTASFDRFAVYGDMRVMEETPSSPIITFDRTEVVKINDNWQYQDARYWMPNYEHSFVAIHPLSVLEAAQYADSKLTFTYTLPSSNDNTADIIYATHRRLYQEGDAVTPIFFQFGHLFSLINFSVELTEPATRSEECFKIHKLEMSGFGTSATINVEPATLQSNKETNDSKFDVLTAKGNGSLEINFDEPIDVINGATAIKMFDDNNALILLPQTFEGNEMVQISLTYTVNDEAAETQVTAPLSSFRWESGKSYNYKIKLESEAKDVNMVISEATIAPWNLVEDPKIVDAK